MHIVLLLLKILGILLLCLLLILLFVLIVPFRYQFDLFADETTDLIGHARISWLLHSVLIKADYDDQGLIYSLRVLGFTIASNSPEYLEKEEEKRREKEKKAADREDKEKLKEETLQEGIVEEESKEEILQEGRAEEEPVEETLQEDRVLDGSADRDLQEDGAEEEYGKGISEEEKEKSPRKKQSELSKAVQTIDHLRDRSADVTRKVRSAQEYYDKYHGEALLRKLFELLGKISKHILPRTLSGHMHFGFEDPSYTGYAAGLAASMYPFYGGFLRIEPDFLEECFDADLKGSGLIRQSYLVFLVIWLLLDSDVRRFGFNVLKKKL